MKAKHVVPVQQKGCIRFHEEAGSSNSHSGFSSLGDDHVFEGVVVPTEATVGVAGTNDVFVVDVSSKVHITDNILFGDERDVFVTRVSNEAVAPVVVAPAFDAIEEWLAEDNDSDAPITADLPVKIPAKRSSGGSDPSKAKRARSITTSSVPKDSRVLKAGMSSSRNSSVVVDKQPRRGK
ncbi:hypothetical protein V6N12_063809 [Hibiscus sabdariffa]|uniref:Uncharacterized protein n=1 Tax=Hibiscus sabdariffa TaxID=183260 RepID=A0ABR2BCL0_9ROSI